MSDEEREEHEGAEEGESEHEWIQRLGSPELRMLHLLEKFSRRVDENDEAARHRSDEMQRNMDFIIQQPAQFGTDLQQLRDMHARSEQKWERTAEGISALLAIAEIHEREINELGQAQARTGAQMAETDERLNALINTVERVISERRNGGRKESEGGDE